MKNIILILFLVSFYLTTVYSQTDTNDYTRYVNPFIGTGGHGHTYPGASMPFGMVQLSPDTRLTGWDGCSGYHYSDSLIYGFSHTHLSGTGCSDYGDILLMPTVGGYFTENQKYSSNFNHKNESSKPGFYKVFLDKYNITASLSATKRTGFHKYEYPQTDSANILIDLKHRDEVIDSRINIINKQLITGYRFSRAWATNQKVFFAVSFSEPISRSSISVNDTLTDTLKTAEGKNIKAFFSFDLNKDRTVFVRVGISAVSIENAIKNIDSETEGLTFDSVVNMAKSEWNKELSKIQINTDSQQKYEIFYSSLYHCMLNPNLYSDADSSYRGRDDKIHKTEGFDYYTVFSLWDTYRAYHPLMTIIDQKRTNAFINTFLKEYEQGGLLPVWELSSNETYCMIGYHSVPVIVDAYIKGIRNYNLNLAFKAMKHSSDTTLFGLEFYKTLNYIPGDKDNESVSKTLEYGYDDWCIAQMAKGLNKKDDYKTYIKRSQAYKNVFDFKTGFMRARYNGIWYSPFDPKEVNNNYTEANCWQYNFYVPHDLSTFIKLMGGKEKFTAKLDELFSTDSKMSGREQSDISGLIGQYAHGNEPSHHLAYLFDYSGEPWKTQKYTRKIMDEFYKDDPDGLIGNEDCGQMSAWYVLSSLGFYPVCPGQKDYAFGTPIHQKSIIKLENGKTFTIISKNLSQKNIYIQSANLNGNAYNKCFISHDSIIAGGTLELNMGPEPNKIWGSKEGDYPKTEINEYPITSVPTIIANNKTFRKKMEIGFEPVGKAKTILFTIDGTEPDTNSIEFYKPFLINKSTTIKAIAKDSNGISTVVTGNFYSIPENRTVNLLTKYNKQYTAGGPDGLIDNIRGEKNFRLGGWQGYQDTDFIAVIDLGQKQKITKISAGFLQDVNAWIWMPLSIEYSVSDDGKIFSSVQTINNTLSDKDYTVTIKDWSIKADVTARYVKVSAKNYGTIPSWHAGAGGKAFIFVDEVIVE